MSVYAGPTDDWWNLTGGNDILRTNIATERVIQDGLLLNLDAGVSSSYPGSGTTWTDLSGNGNNGTLTNMDAANLDGANGGSLSFDGSNEYVNFGNNSTLYNAYNTTFTQEFWVNLISGASTDRSIFRVDDWSRISLLISTSQLGFTIGYGGPTDTLNYNSTFNYNQWYCISIVWSKLVSQQIYLNGNLVAQRTPTVSNYSGITGTTGGANIGRGHSYPYSQYINANIGAFKHYNRVLTPQEIQQNFNALRSRFGI